MTPDDGPLGQPGTRARAGDERRRAHRGATAAPVLAIAGLYLAAWGYSPGGGFPAGAVMLGVVLLLYAGFGRTPRRASRPPDAR